MSKCASDASICTVNVLVKTFISFLGPSDDLNDDQKRWLTVGICLHTVISPVLRSYILPVLVKLYYRLTITHKIDIQAYQFYLKTYSSKKLNYENINNNKNIFGKHIYNYDYRVKNPVDLSKLFLLTSMTKYQNIDDSCDMSALLGIIINIDKFPVSVRTHSEKGKYVGPYFIISAICSL